MVDVTFVIAVVGVALAAIGLVGILELQKRLDNMK